MAIGITKGDTRTEIPPVPAATTGSQTSNATESQPNPSNRQDGRTGETYLEILQKLRQLEADIEKERDHREIMELEFQAERETLNDTIAVLETKLSNSDAGNPTLETESLIARITAESVAAATSAAMAAFSSNPVLSKPVKKHALSAANYVSAETVERSGVIPEIVLRTARKGFFIPFSDLTASQYRDYTLNDRTIKKVTRAVENSTGLIEAEYVDDSNSDIRDRNLPKHEWLEAQTRFIQLLQMEGVADDVTVENFRHLHKFIVSHTLWDFNFPVLARAEHTLRRKFFTSPFSFADANLEREVQNAQTAYNQETFQMLAKRITNGSDLAQPSQSRIQRERNPISSGPIKGNLRSPFEGATSALAPRLVAGAAGGLATGPQTVHCRQQQQGTQFVHDQPMEESRVYQTPKSTATMATSDVPVSNKTANLSTSVRSVVAKATELDQRRAEDKARVVTKY
ncbi:hypothetical protein BS47DRAFT_1386052 [Hydnum rufescens UP504]|uniref:Uncharacterized protein n=1 Tax=Hydnum rufescens UP504 TaxID=1448309 RepID=A0A9P6AFR8_9AGAM|nr:hypothetical protein BS47DRAFT_1386052 [Hydnum rufescens UP504]